MAPTPEPSDVGGINEPNASMVNVDALVLADGTVRLSLYAATVAGDPIGQYLRYTRATTDQFTYADVMPPRRGALATGQQGFQLRAALLNCRPTPFVRKSGWRTIAPSFSAPTLDRSRRVQRALPTLPERIARRDLEGHA
jgi:hypothetical protein